MKAEEFPFPVDPAAVEYRLFPPDLEGDPHVFFHGTAAISKDSILAEGFRPIPPLESVSFAKGSPLALSYACSKRDASSPYGCVIAVRFDDLTRSGLVEESSILYDYTRDPPPRIIGYCIVPAAYTFS